ncbi:MULTISPECIES: transposase [unclassified Chryseobacterium]|uniref:transposase n=1 Tax=unclassified Chryseobacterium TaxID=2593645 RepID=UPI0009565D1B|nr:MULTISPECIES: transposase [unclassified Chryseobacterium]SIQ53117.1 hypothetical protein SAMN05880573_106139 [Chryseobacterium sp. RU33C]
MKKGNPNYKLIYSDMIDLKYPFKKEQCASILNKEQFTCLDVININKIIFGENESEENKNQKFKCYDKNTIFKILEYQKENHLTNTQVAAEFKMSRNTLASWKKKYIIK